MVNDQSFHKARDRDFAIWVMLTAFVVVFPLLLIWPSVDMTTKPKRGRHPSKNNLKQIGLALHEYHENYGVFPPAFLADKNGQPKHSWRVLILPYLGEQKLYDSYRFDQPWHGPDNWKLINKMPDCFRFRRREEDDQMEFGHPAGTTIYVAPRGDGTVISGVEGVSVDDITDGTSYTIQVVEDSLYPVPWLAPDDVSFDLCLKHLQTSDPDGIPSGQHILLCDGTVRFVTNDLDEKVFRNLLIRNDGEEVGAY